MPYKSEAQRGFFHSPTGRKKISAAVIAEWDKASKGKKLPAHVKAKNHALRKAGRC